MTQKKKQNPTKNSGLSFQELIFELQKYWSTQECIIVQPYDMEMGAGTFHPATFLRSIGPEPWRTAYTQASRRPTDGRFGENPNRLQHYYQFQVVLKPSPDNIQELYLASLAAIGIDTKKHDIRFVEDNWEGPTLGAWGIGWEIWVNGMEIGQFTYLQQVGGLECKPVMCELAYGLERIAMYLQGKDSIYDLLWCCSNKKNVTYADIYQQNELEMSIYNFEQADTELLFSHFYQLETECQRIIKLNLPLPAYEMVLNISHLFNLLDARNALSVTERQGYILRVRNLARTVADSYYESRKKLGFPLLVDFVKTH